jgi:hypothetical protein
LTGPLQHKQDHGELAAGIKKWKLFLPTLLSGGARGWAAAPVGGESGPPPRKKYKAREPPSGGGGAAGVKRKKRETSSSVEGREELSRKGNTGVAAVPIPRRNAIPKKKPAVSTEHPSL